MHRLEAFGKWLHDMSLAAATNGQRAEEAAVANTEAVMAMPSVAEAVQAKDVQDMMASLAAYNGAILNGNFAEIDEAARTQQANAAAVMRQYEDAVTALAQPWQQPASRRSLPGRTRRRPTRRVRRVAAGEQPAAERVAVPYRCRCRRGQRPISNLVRIQSRCPGPLLAAVARDSAGWAPAVTRRWPGMAATARAGNTNRLGPPGRWKAAASRVPASAMRGHLGQPAAQPAEFTVSSVSWGPDSAIFDELAAAPEPVPEGFAEEPARTLEQVSDGWVSPPVIGANEEVLR